MGLFDSLMKSAGNAIKNETVKAVNNAGSSVGKGSNRTESFTFASLPNSLAELQAMPEASLDSAFKTTALTIAVLCAYEKNPDGCIEMLNFLKGPAEVSTYEKQFIRERLNGKGYKARSFFAGATPENGYKPTIPYVISVSENPYSYQNEGYATLYITSGGADSPRSVQMRKAKDGKWYLWEQFILVGIRQPESANPWA